MTTKQLADPSFGCEGVAQHTGGCVSGFSATGSDPFQCVTWRCLPLPGIFISLGIMLLAAQGLAQNDDPLPPPSTLKKLSVEELLDIDVTSVS